MINTHILEIIRRFSQNELREASLFLKSEFNNHGHLRNDVIRLFEIFTEAYPDFKPDKLEKEKVVRRLFPSGPPAKGKLEKIRSELNILIKDFLLWKYYQSEQSDFIRAMHWSNILRDRSLDDRYKQSLQKIENEHLNDTGQSPQQYLHRFLVEYERHFWMSKTNGAKKDVNLTATIDSLSVFFEIYRLELLNRILLQQKVTQLDFTPAIKHNLDNALSLVPEQANIILSISSEIHRLLKKDLPTLEEFRILMEILTSHESQIHPETLSEYYAYLRNFCTILINSRNYELTPVLHHLQMDNLKRGYLYVENKLLASTYLNIARIAILSSNTDWAIAFVESHKNKVIGETEDLQFYHINKAQCLFAKRQFQEALDILPPTSENAMYYLLARRLEVMCYYELHADNIIGKIEAFKMLIRRASEKFLSPALRDVNNAFANILYQIVLSPKGDKKRANVIEERIKVKKKLAESRWLLAKVKELK